MSDGTPALARIEEAFLSLRSLRRDERDTRLARLRDEDPALHREVASLLAAEDGDASFLERSVIDAHPHDVDREAAAAGDEAGPYELVERLGRGGMGEVWLGRRTDGAYEADVAVKVIRRGLDTDDVLERFRRERRVLARLDHPHVARVLDAGAMPDGRPFLVMERVDGRPIDEYCDAEDLELDARLELIIRVCDAVEAAHRRLIVHRDLKPSNVLVTSEGAPKLLDFGIASMLDPEDETSAIATAPHARRYTPAYAAPELARGEPTSTATDVYGLGVLLHELVTGERPEAGALASQHLARADHATRPKWARRVRGDLDRIIAVATHDEPARRYASAERLAADLRGFLDHRPVAARTDSLRYRAGKFVRRNPAPVALASVAVLALVGATAVSTWFALEATRQARIANAVVDFVRDDLLGRADPAVEPRPDIQLRELLDRASSTVDDRFPHEPLVRAALRTTLGVAYLGLGEAEAAVTEHEAAWTDRSAALGPGHSETLRARSAMVGALIDAAAYEEAGAIVDELDPIVRRRLGPDHPVTLATLKHRALVADGLGAYEEAIAGMEAAVAAHAGALGDEHPDTLTARNDLALMLAEAGRLDEAERTVRAVLDARERVLGPDHPDTLLSLGSLGFVLGDLGRAEEAEGGLREALRRARAGLGADHPRTAIYLDLLANALRGQDRSADALPFAREALAIRRARLGDEHPETMVSITLEGSLLQDLGRLDEAFARLQERYDLGVRVQGADHPSTLIAANNLAGVLIDLDRAGEAADLARDTVAQADAALPAGHWLVGAFATTQGRALIAAGRNEEADAVLAAAEVRLADALGADHARVGRVRKLRATIGN